MFKVALFGITAALLSMLLKKDRGELAVCMGIVSGIVIFGYILAQISLVIDFAKEITTLLPFDGSYLSMVLKMLGITYVADFAANICSDSGHHAIAGQIEVFAKITIVVISIPMLKTFLSVVNELL